MSKARHRPREHPPQGLTADKARRIVDKSDESYRAIAIALRQRCDQAIAAVSSTTKEHLRYAIPYSIPGFSLFFLKRSTVIRLLVEGLRRDKYWSISRATT